MRDVRRCAWRRVRKEKIGQRMEQIRENGARKKDGLRITEGRHSEMKEDSGPKYLCSRSDYVDVAVRRRSGDGDEILL